MQGEGAEAVIDYKPLWKTLEKKKISQYQLMKTYGVSSGQLARLRANQHVSTHTLEMLCKILDCEISDIIEYVKE